MKKLLLGSAACVIAMSSFAQSSNVSSMVFSHAAQALPANREVATKMPVKHVNNKTTATSGSWFNYSNIMNNVSSTPYYNAMAPDSTLKATGGSSSYNIYMHGFGTSFDPTDSAFMGGDIDLNTSAGTVTNTDFLPSFRVFSTSAYTVDSIAFPFQYLKGDNTGTDTLVIQIGRVPKSGSAQNLYALFFSGLTDITPNGKPGFVTGVYDTGSQRLLNSPNLQTITKVMDAAFVADTANGLSNYTTNGIALPTAINASAGDAIIAFVSMHCQNKYALNTPAASGNWAKFYSWDITGAGPKQNTKSVEAGLVANNQTRYHPKDSLGFHFVNGSDTLDILLPNIAFSKDGLFTDFSMHVVCSTCPDLSVANISNIASFSAYPNPANTEVAVPFALKNAANTTITLTNTMGQVIASQSFGNTNSGKAVFNTSNLANGLYFYTIVADGAHRTGRVVVAH